MKVVKTIFKSSLSNKDSISSDLTAAVFSNKIDSKFAFKNELKPVSIISQAVKQIDKNPMSRMIKNKKPLKLKMKSIQEAPQYDEIKIDTYLGDSSRSEYNGSGISSKSE